MLTVISTAASCIALYQPDADRMHFILTPLRRRRNMQTACTEGCPIQPNATCVTGKRLAHALLRTSGRVTTQRSAVVTRTYSGPKCRACRIFLNARPNAARIMASFAKHFFDFGNDNGVWFVYTRYT